MIEINLLPKELQIQGPRLAFSKAMIVPIAGAVVVVAAMVGLTLYQKSQIRSLESKIHIAQARAEQLKRDIEMVDALVDIKEKITARIEAVKVLDQNRSTWVNLLEDLSGRVPEFLWLTAVREVAPPPTKPTPATAAQDTTATRDQSPTVVQVVPTEIEGYAYSLNSLATLMVSMKKSGYFDQIDLSHAREVQLEEHPAYSFLLTCNIDYSGTANEQPGLEGSGEQELAAKTQ